MLFTEGITQREYDGYYSKRLLKVCGSCDPRHYSKSSVRSLVTQVTRLLHKLLYAT